MLSFFFPDLVQVGLGFSLISSFFRTFIVKVCWISQVPASFKMIIYLCPRSVKVVHYIYWSTCVEPNVQPGWEITTVMCSCLSVLSISVCKSLLDKIHIYVHHRNWSKKKKKNSLNIVALLALWPGHKTSLTVYCLHVSASCDWVCLLIAVSVALPQSSRHPWTFQHGLNSSNS